METFVNHDGIPGKDSRHWLGARVGLQSVADEHQNHITTFCTLHRCVVRLAAYRDICGCSDETLPSLQSGTCLRCRNP
jgi:hypothetical protein